MAELDKGSRVLVVAPNWLGDLVMCEPAIRALATARPDLHLTVQVPAGLASIAERMEGVSEVLAIDRRGEHGGLFGRFKVWAAMREGRHDVALLFRNSFGSALDASRAGIPRQVGFVRWPRGMFVSQGIPFPEDFRTTHRTRSFFTLVEALGVEVPEWGSPETLPHLPVPDEARASAEARIRAAAKADGSDSDELERPLVAIHPGAAYGPAKMWGEQKFAQAADRLIEDQNATVVFLGSKDEVPLVARIVAAMDWVGERPERVRNLAGATASAGELADVLAACDLMLGNDSGPSHLAAAVGTPTVAIFGSTSADFSAARGAKATAIWENLDCSPCGKRECPREDYMACMDAIPAARAYRAASELMSWKEPDFEDIEGRPGDAPSAADLED